MIFVLVFAGELLGQLGWGLFLIGFFVINWFYPVFFELFGNGATPGKRVFGLQVIKQNGTPVDLAASLVRNLLRTADYLPFFFGVGLVSMLSNRGFRRLGDLAAGTLVVYSGSQPGVWRTIANRASQPTAPSVALNLREQRALVSFAQRASFLGAARAKELAQIIAPCVDSRPISGPDPVASLTDLAAWITGEKR